MSDSLAAASALKSPPWGDKHLGQDKDPQKGAAGSLPRPSASPSPGLFGIPLSSSPSLLTRLTCPLLGSDDGHPRRQLCGGNQAATERIILFGRELQALSEQLGREYGKNLAHTEMLQVRDKCHTQRGDHWVRRRRILGYLIKSASRDSPTFWTLEKVCHQCGVPSVDLTQSLYTLAPPSSQKYLPVPRMLLACWRTQTPGAAPWASSSTPSRGSLCALPSTAPF